MKYESSLQHYGIKGMKWGVRRYQNYDGSYTQRGLARYRKAESEYESSAAKRKATKQAYKSGTASKTDVRAAKQDTKQKRKALEKSYKQLKQDKLADQGKELYRRGKTITGNSQFNAIAQASIIMGSGIVNRLLAASTGNTEVANLATGAIAAGATAINGIIYAKTQYQNKRLRAYYAH